MHIVNRARRLLLEPAVEWRSIAVERDTIGTLFLRYALILAAIPSLATFIGYSLLGLNVLGHPVRLPLVRGLGAAAASYLLWLAGIWITALVIELLAPRFGGRADLITGLKLAAHAPTAAWVASIFLAFPGLRILSLLGLASIYTVAVGLPIVTRCPPDEAPGFAAIVVICYLAIAIAIAFAGTSLLPGIMG